MNYKQAEGAVMNDQHLKDLLESLRKELSKHPKPTIGELMKILSQEVLCDTVSAYRKIRQTAFDFGEIQLIRYFPILWMIIVEEYPNLGISEYNQFEDQAVTQYFLQFKQYSRSSYIEYIQSL